MSKRSLIPSLFALLHQLTSKNDSSFPGDDQDTELPDYWNQDLQCALHLNLSVAYKAIGDVHKAKRHAELYVIVVQGCETKQNAEARSRLNIGTLHEILGEYEQAEEHFKAYLDLSKSKSDKKGIAQAYGCLGSVYAHLGNTTLSATFHEQHVALAKKSDNPKMLVIALEQTGDSYTALGQHDKAADSYSLMLQACQRGQPQNKTTALVKLGSANRAQDRYQHSTHYYEQAKALAEDCGYTTITIMCDYNVVCIMQHSTQARELDQAKKNFQKLIPLFEAKIQQHKDEDTFCPTELHVQLKSCYEGIQNVLAKMGKKAECLEYSEAFKKKHSSQKSEGHIGMFDMWLFEKMMRVVGQQNATVLYYTVLPSRLLIWVLQPGEGLTRFYSLKSAKESHTMTEQIQDLVSEVKLNRDLKELSYSCENRSLPLQETRLELIKKKNKALSQESKREKFVESLQQSMKVDAAEQSDKEKMERQKPVQRRLFDLLIVPVEDILSGLEPDSSLIIVPDGVLYQCPFSVLQDWRGQTLGTRFHLTCLPSLHALEKVEQSELDQLKHQDELQFQRSQARMGGAPKVLTQADYAQLTRKHDTFDAMTEDDDDIDLRKISNPRLVTSGSKGSRGQTTTGPLVGSRQNSFLSQTTVSTARTARRPGALSTIPSVTTCTSPRTPRELDTPTRK